MNHNPCTFKSDIAVARAIIIYGVQTSSLVPYRWRLGRRAVTLRKRLLAFPVLEIFWVLELEGQAAKYRLGEHWRDPHRLPKFGGRRRMLAEDRHFLGSYNLELLQWAISQAGIKEERAV
jgi:hypothetical protein